MAKRYSPTFFSIDLILTPKGDVKILEFNRGVDSGFAGYEALTGDDMWLLALERIVNHYHIHPDRFYYDEIDAGVARLPQYLKPLSDLQDTGEGAIIFPADATSLGYLRRLYPKAIIFDDCVPLMASFRNKAIFQHLFAKRMPDMLPRGRVLSVAGKPLGRHAFAAVSSRGAGVVIKNTEGIQGEGVHIFAQGQAAMARELTYLRMNHAQNGAETAGMLPLTYEDMVTSVSDGNVAVLQALAESATIDINGAAHHSCIRVAMLLLPDAQGVQATILGGYHKPAAQPVQCGTADMRYKSSVSTPRGSGDRAVMLSRAERAQVDNALLNGQALRAITRVMGMDSADMMLGLLNTRDANMQGAALYALFSRHYFDESEMGAQDVRRVQAALEGAMARNARLKQQVFLRVLRGDDAHMPHIFKGVVQRAFLNEVGLYYGGLDPVTRVMHRHILPNDFAPSFAQQVIAAQRKTPAGKVISEMPDVRARQLRMRSIKREFVIKSVDFKPVFKVFPFTAPFYCGVEGCVKPVIAKKPADFAKKLEV